MFEAPPVVDLALRACWSICLVSTFTVLIKQVRAVHPALIVQMKRRLAYLTLVAVAAVTALAIGVTGYPDQMLAMMVFPAGLWLLTPVLFPTARELFGKQKKPPPAGPGPHAGRVTGNPIPQHWLNRDTHWTDKL
jgi:hypothetical protein